MSKAACVSRRTLCLMLPALAVSAAHGEEKSPLASQVFEFQGLPAHRSGSFSARQVLEGWTHEGCRISLHESDLAPGGVPHPPHHHRHEEMFLMREGTLEVTIAGKSSRLGPGDVAYAASNEEHGVRNTGSTHAKYFVLELGSDK
jgi:mannose-6-phosphate isomerase-like protein (cupin superfamily)